MSHARRVDERASSCRTIGPAAIPMLRPLWNHLGFNCAAMQARQEGSVVVEMLNHYRRPLRAGDLLGGDGGLAAFSEQGADLHPFPFPGRDRYAGRRAEAVGMKFDQKLHKIMTFTAEDLTRLAERRPRLA